MKRIFAFATLMCVTLSVLAQKVEFTAQAYSGLYRFDGAAAVSNSVIVGTKDRSASYTSNPYGNKNAISYGAALQAQVVAGGHFIVGLQTGYEVLRSSVDINTYYPYNDQIILYNSTAIAQPSMSVTGSTHLESNYININPYIGYRIGFSKVNIDLLPGIDIGLQTAEPREKGSIKLNDGSTYTTRYSHEDRNDTDIRLRFGLAANFSRFGITANYAHGLSNRYPMLYYAQDMPGKVPDDAHSELFRFGISYRLN